MIIPDLWTISYDFSATPGYGGGGTIQLNILMRGKEKGFFFTWEGNQRVGLEGSLSAISAGSGWFLGDPRNATRSSLLGTFPVHRGRTII